MSLKLSVHQKGTKRRKQKKKTHSHTHIGVRKRDEMIFENDMNIKKKMMKNWSC